MVVYTGSVGLWIELSRVTALTSWTTHFTLTVPLSTQMYKWVPANFMLGRGGGVEILLVSCYRNQEKLCQCGSLVAMQTQRERVGDT